MTDLKKTGKAARATKAKKLQVNKETLKDLSASKNAQVKGGAPTGGERCTQRATTCTYG